MTVNYYGRFFQPTNKFESDGDDSHHQCHNAGAKVVVAFQFVEKSLHHSMLKGHQFLLEFAQAQFETHAQQTNVLSLQNQVRPGF